MQNKKNILIIILILAVIVLAYFAFKPKNVGESIRADIPVGDTVNEKDNEVQVKDTYKYINHGFSIELPKGFVPKVERQHSGPALIISLPVPEAHVAYLTDANIDFWQVNIKEYQYIKDKKIGETIFKVYTYSGTNIYWYQKGKVAYEFSVSDKNKDELEKLLETFKFVGWPQIEGNKEDLVSFSIKPGQEVSGKMQVTGSVKNGYFFEGNIVIGILDSNKKKTSYGPGYANANTDWMTSGPVSFSFDLDFNLMPKGEAYIEIHNDNASGLPEHDKSILIPIVIK